MIKIKTECSKLKEENVQLHKELWRLKGAIYTEIAEGGGSLDLTEFVSH